MTRHEVPGYAHALYMRAAVRALMAGEPVPSVDTPTEVFAASEPDQAILRAPDDPRRARLFDVIEERRRR